MRYTVRASKKDRYYCPLCHATIPQIVLLSRVVKRTIHQKDYDDALFAIQPPNSSSSIQQFIPVQKSTNVPHRCNPPVFLFHVMQTIPQDHHPLSTAPRDCHWMKL
eukprot:TRINITY_DN313_c0_g1_i1.p2 TRINITY_DN313_c0_g1~~TRINITY_DN313_c0_g1_i1.p2  ORF type:complete len:106 (+),score=6.12 TRINITY_DN313_c0_g1_i1:1096-1413(+)